MQTMNSQPSGPPPFSLRFLLTIVAVAMVTGLVLSFLDAPFWAFWISPIVIGPFMLHEAGIQMRPRPTRLRHARRKKEA